MSGPGRRVSPRSTSSIRTGYGARVCKHAPDRPTEPPIHSILRRTLAAVTLSVFATLSIAAGGAINPSAAYANSSGGSSTPVSAVTVQGTSRGATVARWAQAQTGKRYVFGATGPSSFDCSGLSMRAWAQVGVRLPHQSGQQMRYGRAISRSQLQPGDLIFWNGHVAVSLGGNKIVHAANSRVGVVRGTIYGSPIGYRRL